MKAGSICFSIPYRFSDSVIERLSTMSIDGWNFQRVDGFLFRIWNGYHVCCELIHGRPTGCSIDILVCQHDAAQILDPVNCRGANPLLQLALRHLERL